MRFPLVKFYAIKKGAEWLPLKCLPIVCLFDYQLLCVYFVAAYDTDVIYAACIVACVEFVGFNACLNIVRQDYSALQVADDYFGGGCQAA